MAAHHHQQPDHSFPPTKWGFKEIISRQTFDKYTHQHHHSSSIIICHSVIWKKVNNTRKLKKKNSALQARIKFTIPWVLVWMLNSLRYWRLCGEQSQNLIVTIVYFKYFQVHNTLRFRKSPVLQSAFSRNTYWLFVLFFSILFFQYQGYFVSTLSSLLFLNWSMKGLKFPTVQLRALLAAILKIKKKL